MLKNKKNEKNKDLMIQINNGQNMNNWNFLILALFNWVDIQHSVEPTEKEIGM